MAGTGGSHRRLTIDDVDTAYLFGPVGNHADSSVTAWSDGFPPLHVQGPNSLTWVPSSMSRIM